MALHTETEPTPAPAARAEARTDARSEPRAEAAPRAARRPPIALFVVGVVAIGLLGLGLRQWSFSRTHVVSDDAQVEGHIIPVLPRVSGYVAQVRVSENQNVRAGDTLVLLDNRDYRARLDQTEADLAAAIATAGERGRSSRLPALRRNGRPRSVNISLLSAILTNPSSIKDARNSLASSLCSLQ